VVAEHIVARASQLRAEQAQWEGLRQQAAAKLLELANRKEEASPDVGMQLDDEQERVRSQLSAALFHMQEIGRELTEIREDLEAQAREAESPAYDPERERMELVRRDDARNEQLAKDAADKLDVLRKDEQLKEDTLDKEQSDKEFFDKKESDRLEAQQSDLELLADINEQWEYIQGQIAEEFEYIQGEIAKEMEYVVEEIGKEYEYIEQQVREEIKYNKDQARDAAAEAFHEVKTAFLDPVNQKEANEFLEARKQALEDFVADEVFKSAPADVMEAQLRDKVSEQWREEEKTFGGRNDSLDVRDVAKKALADAQETLLKAVESIRQIEAEENRKSEVREEARNATAERLEKNGYSPEVLEEKLKLLDEAVKKDEQQSRAKAEDKCKEVWDTAQVEVRAIFAEACGEAERQDAEARKQAERKMEDAFRNVEDAVTHTLTR
jgi:hypothetical protein